ncbi:MAG: patatin-like phospholipase family protein [Candidatus Obscuribacterales bacterium]|nr:patatin-like phospholipase family protein [Candidatus Obscuribacterales bacterium]
MKLLASTNRSFTLLAAAATISISFALGYGMPSFADDAEAGQVDPKLPKIITNPTPAKTPDKDAQKVLDSNPATKETVDESPVPKLIEKPTTQPGNSQSTETKVEKRKTLALALGGGGVRGAAHIGLLRVLEQEGIPIDYIVGNSMGAVIGGLYSSGVSLDKLETLAKDGIFKKNYAPMAIPKAIAIPLKKMMPRFGRKSFAGIVSGNKFEKALAKMIPEGHDNFDHLKVPFSAVATDLTDGKAYRISEGKLSRAIRASSTLSPILKPVKIGNRVYVDGAIRANLPASSARDTGADVVLAVLVDEPLRKLPEKSFYTFKGVAQRLADIVLAVTDEHQLQFANVVVNPDVSGIPILGDNEQNILKAVRAGEIAARKALPEIRKQLNLTPSTRIVDTSAPVN